MLNPQELEKILVANWTAFLDFRKCLDFAGECAAKYANVEPPCRADKLTISRFEFTRGGFLIWLDYSIGTIQLTTEVILDCDGTLTHVKTL